MPFFPDFLLKLSQRDEQVTWLDPVVRLDTTAAAAVTNNALWTVPADRVCILQSLSAISTPGAAQNVVLLLVGVAPPGAAFFVDLARADTFVAGAVKALSWSGSILVPPGWLVVGRSSYSAGAAVNTVSLSSAGILVPAANIQRV